jgi:hypothetical protein
MAGLAAARALGEAGLAVAVLEARDRIGGRAVTDTATFGVPVDLGCSWLHAAPRNPLTPVARRLGFAPEPDDAAPLAAGVAFEDLAVMDWAAQVETGDDDALLRAGLGTLVARYGAGLPVRLGTPVTRVRWDGPGVAVETAAGTLRGRATRWGADPWAGGSHAAQRPGRHGARTALAAPVADRPLRPNASFATFATPATRTPAVASRSPAAAAPAPPPPARPPPPHHPEGWRPAAHAPPPPAHRSPARPPAPRHRRPRPRPRSAPATAWSGDTPIARAVYAIPDPRTSMAGAHPSRTARLPAGPYRAVGVH